MCGLRSQLDLQNPSESLQYVPNSFLLRGRHPLGARTLQWTTQKSKAALSIFHNGYSVLLPLSLNEAFWNFPSLSVGRRRFPCTDFLKGYLGLCGLYFLSFRLLFLPLLFNFLPIRALKFLGLSLLFDTISLKYCTLLLPWHLPFPEFLRSTLPRLPPLPQSFSQMLFVHFHLFSCCSVRSLWAA